MLKEFEKKDYRGVCQLLADCSELRDAIGLKRVPHFTTLQKASRRLLKQRHVRRLIVCCIGHAILAAVASAGPTPDIDQLDSVVAELPASVSIRHMVADAGFDSAHNHRLLREECGIRSTIPPEHDRPSKNPDALPADKYRRLMKTRFNAKSYRKRPQVETVFSMVKRNFGQAWPQPLGALPRFVPSSANPTTSHSRHRRFSTEPE